MTLLFHDGFDASAAGAGVNIGATGNGYLGLVGWLTSSTGSSSLGRDGIGMGLTTATAYFDLPANKSTLIVGQAIYTSIADGRQVLAFLDAGTIQICLTISGGAGAPVLQVRRGNESGTILGQTSAGVFTLSVWNFWEVKVVFDTGTGTDGSVEVRKNGGTTPVINVTGADTTNTANSYCNQVRLESNAVQVIHDDVYVLDTAGSLNNDFLGDCASYVYDPDADGTVEDWTRSTGTDSWALLDETPASEADYIETGTNGHKTRLLHEDVDTADTVFGVTQYAFARKTDITVCSVRTIQLVNSVEYNGSSVVMSTSYQGVSRLMETNPNTGSQWTPAQINASEFGVEAII